MRMIAAALVLLLASLPAWSAIYRWTDSQGNIHFSDKPHPGAKRVDHLPPLETYSPPNLAPAQTSQSPSRSNGQGSAAPRDRYQTLRLTHPQPKQTFRSAERKVPVTVKVAPGLATGRGDKLVYYLDGKRAAGPTTSTHIVLDNVNRGTHDVAAAVVGANGKELIRSVPVTFYMKPPIANRHTPAFGG